MNIRHTPLVHTDDARRRVGGEPAFLMGFETDETIVYQIRRRHREALTLGLLHRFRRALCRGVGFLRVLPVSEGSLHPARAEGVVLSPATVRSILFSPPYQPESAYRPVNSDLDVEGILGFKHRRKVVKDGAVKYD